MFGLLIFILVLNKTLLNSGCDLELLLLINTVTACQQLFVSSHLWLFTVERQTVSTVWCPSVCVHVYTLVVGVL